MQINLKGRGGRFEYFFEFKLIDILMFRHKKNTHIEDPHNVYKITKYGMKLSLMLEKIREPQYESYQKKISDSPEKMIPIPRIG